MIVDFGVCDMKGMWAAVNLALGVAFGAPAFAQTPTVDEAIVLACFEKAEGTSITTPACIGDAAEACFMVPEMNTTLGIVGCQVAEAEVWDRLLNETYRDVLSVFLGFDAEVGTEPYVRVDALRDAQRAWIAFRDAECTMRYAQYQDGTIRGPVHARCMLQLTAERTLRLAELISS